MSDFVLRRLAAFLLALLAVGGLAASATAGPSTTHTDPYVPPADTIVQVEGDAANGFGIRHYDGSWHYPPTDSETMAECGEYDREIRRFRCKVANRAWFRALAGFKETTRYYRSLQ
ncbi:hypothetical protein [Nocardioides bizhenqiangii]|uniref:Secreted protein n=1 Tax=Nocardioides bizhenqiangii TaxID=3095076 RepID=A0ABZ0ZVQ3_9ACTN|nr:MULTISPECIES: hypothetical protein [unclassified Nocardioides]MDZ5621984.1 hypothetical protein [Nocardioides sp. HM23]WQQ27338.1 hypothetical protein SHK19_03710 [Nocardioides sp. HM61]